MDDVVSRRPTRFPDEIGFGEERILTNTMGFLVGGFCTISQAVVQIVEHPLAHPEQFAGAKRAAEDGADELLYKYCFEALRFNPINPVVVRTCAEDCTVARGTLRWVRVKKHFVVFVGTRSAMMEPIDSSRPREFRLDRPEHHYMHFGFRTSPASATRLPASIFRKLPNTFCSLINGTRSEPPRLRARTVP